MRWKIVTLALFLICLAIGIAVWQDNSSRQTLPDGTVLVLSGVRIARTNIYTHGTLLSKVLGRFAPPGGISVAGLKLKPPEKITFAGSDGCEVLSAEIRLLPGSPRQTSFLFVPFFRAYRLLISGDNGLAFVQEFNGFNRKPDGIFAHIRTESFPRESKQLRFRLEERGKPQGRDWHEVSTFVVKNPKPALPKTWKPEHSPLLKLSEDLQVQIGELTVRSEPIHPDDIWEQMALLPVRVTYKGQISTNWGIHAGPIWDASGNHDYFTFSKLVTNDWMFYRMFRPMDPSKAWRFQVNFALDSDYPATNLYTFTIPLPLAVTIQTNGGGFPVKIGVDQYNWLNLEMINKPANTRLSFVGVVDDDGTSLDGRTGSWGQHSFHKSLRLSKPTQVHATVAIHDNYKAEFTLQPRYDPGGDPEDKRK